MQQLEASSSFTLTSLWQKESKGWEPFLFIWASTRAPSLKAASQTALLVVIATCLPGGFTSCFVRLAIFCSLKNSPYLGLFIASPVPIESVNNNIQDNIILYNELLEDTLEIYDKLNIKTLNEIINCLKNKNESILIIKPKTTKK